MSTSQKNRLALLHETEAILAAVKANSARLKQCIGPHNFSICIDRHTKEPIIGEPTPAQRFGAWWRCAKCDGQVENLHKIWYENGVKHGKLELAWQIHASPKPVEDIAAARAEGIVKQSEAVKSIDRGAAYNEAQADERFGW